MDKFPQVGSLAGFGSTKPRKGKKKTQNQTPKLELHHGAQDKL